MGNIKSFLKRWPILYRLLQQPYYGIRRVMEEHIFGTRIQEWIWKTRHIYKGSSWARGYCNLINHPHRQLLVEKISFYAPFESILEIGCNTGPNLYLLAKEFPEAKIYGIDINPQAIKEGKIWLEESGIKNVLLSVGKADELQRFHDKSMDVVFTDALLLYIGPDKIKNVIGEMMRITCKSLVFNEWHWEDNSRKTKGHFYYDGRWVYNYKALFQSFVTEDKIKISKLPKEVWGGVGWEEFGTIIEVRV